MKKFNLRKKIILFLSIPLICSVFLCSFIGLKNSKMNQANAIIEYVDSSIYINELASQTTQLENSYSLDSYYPILPENQTNSNLCWIYSSLKVLETSLMRQKNEYHNFSEIATALLYYENYTLTDSNIQNEFKKIDKEGHFSNFNQVAQNQGLVYENVLSNDVYYDVNEENYENYDFYLDHIDNKIMDNIKPINIYEDETFLKAKPDKKVEILKRYILNYGGFFAGLERGIISSATNVYVNTNEPSHSANDGAIPTSHAVCIIGWNDEKDCGENGKGAFYAINSWGVSSTSFSCFWIPYSYQHIYNDTYGYICVDKVNKDITLLSSTAGETDGFSSKFMNSYSQNPTNLFLYKEELELSYKVADKFNFDSIFVNVYQGQSNVTSKFSIVFDDNNKIVTISANDETILGEGYYIEFYEDKLYVATKDFYVFTGTEMSYIELMDGSADQNIDSMLFNNNFATANFSQTYYIYNNSDVDYYLNFYFPGLTGFNYSKVSFSIGTIYITSTDSNGIITTSEKKESDKINVSTEATQATIPNRYQVKIKHLVRGNFGKLIEFSVNVTSKSSVGTGKTSVYNFKFFISNNNEYENAGSTTKYANNIIYDLDGGINSDRNINRYPVYDNETSMTSFELYQPTKSTSVFIGWYLDKNFTKEITSIGPDIATQLGKVFDEGTQTYISTLLNKKYSEDIIIYAKWEEQDANYFDISLNITNVKDYYGTEKDLNNEFVIIYGDSVESSFVYVPELENLQTYKYTTKYTYWFNNNLIETRELALLGETIVISNDFLKNNTPTLVCGDYNIKIKVVMVVSHQFSITKEISLDYSVQQKEITANFDETTLEYTYDKEYHIPKLLSFNGVYPEDGKLNFEFDNKAANFYGYYTYTVVSIDNDNYKIADNQSCVLYIKKAIISLEWEVTSVVYNGKEQAPKCKFIGLIGDDTVIASYGLNENLSITPEMKNVGEYNIAVKAINNTNYELTGITNCTFKITPSRVTIKFNDISIRFTLAPVNRPSITWSIIEGDLYDDENDLNITYNCDGQESYESGVYPITGTYNNSNYIVEMIVGTYTILGYYYVYYTLPDGTEYRETVDDGQLPKGIDDSIYKKPFLSELEYSEELINTGNTDLYIKVTIKSYAGIVYFCLAVLGFIIVYRIVTRRERRNKNR